MEHGFYWLHLEDAEPEVVEIDGDSMYRCGSDVTCNLEDGRWVEFGEDLAVMAISGPLVPPNAKVEADGAASCAGRASNDELAGIPCPDCGAKPGEQHNDWCDVERCPDCGGQLISCDCEGEFTMPRLPWTGEWPGKIECREFGWYAKLVPGKGWTRCSKDDPQASEDINRLAGCAVWSKERGRFILPANAPHEGPARASCAGQLDAVVGGLRDGADLDAE